MEVSIHDLLEASEHYLRQSNDPRKKKKKNRTSHSPYRLIERKNKTSKY